MSGQIEQRSAPSSSLLVETTEAHDILVGLLPASALGALACTCRALRHTASSTPAAASRWRALVEEEIGITAAALHEELLLRRQCAPKIDEASTSSATVRSPPGTHTKNAGFWRSICRLAMKCDELHWNATGAARLWRNVEDPRPPPEEARVGPSDEAGSDHGGNAAPSAAEAAPHSAAPPSASSSSSAAAAGGSTISHKRLRKQLARSGHSATLIDEAGLIVVAGGLMDDSDDESPSEDGNAEAQSSNGEPGMSLLVIRSPSMEIVSPAFEGPGDRPPNRYRHAAERIPLDVLGPRESSALCKSGTKPEEELAGGYVVAIHGGYQGRFVYDKLLLLWVSSRGSRVRWAEVSCSGTPPPACFHHAMVRLRRSPVLIALGGETASSHLPGGSAYSLWLPTMTWEKKMTLSVDGTRAEEGDDDPDSFEPGAMWLHVAALRPGTPSDKPEEVLVFGGVEPVGLASMRPFILDTESWAWRRAPEPPAEVQDPWNGPPGPLAPPPRRHRTAAVLIGRHLVLHGGCPARGSWLKDTWVLDTSTMQWHQGPQEVQGRPKRHAAIAGHSLQGMLAFGGCTRGIFGISPVAKMDLLLLGPQPESEPQEPEAAVSGSRQRGRRGRRRKNRSLAGLEVLGQVTLNGQRMQVLLHPRHGGIAVPALLYETMLEQQDDADAEDLDMDLSGSDDDSDDDDDEADSESSDSDSGGEGGNVAVAGGSGLDDIDAEEASEGGDDDDDNDDDDDDVVDEEEGKDRSEHDVSGAVPSNDNGKNLVSFPVAMDPDSSSEDDE